MLRFVNRVFNNRQSISNNSNWNRTASYATGARLFDKILIANRGEIACRVMKTAREMGIKTVAVYSNADKDSMHVKLADEAYLIGNAPASESYLLGDKIIQVAKEANAKAIHPGYGFLSENPTFAEQCLENGITFIGPPSPAITAMGSKCESKDIMIKADVPVVPGYHGDDQTDDRLVAEASKILDEGYPVLVKAIMGGGGKGMRIVKEKKDILFGIQQCRSEAKKSFGDERVLVEQFLDASKKPRHIELQVFADTFGNCVYLFERDCSIQRRHQKVVEEAPAPSLNEETRKAMGETAVNAAKAVGYVGAGTVEFIFDQSANKYYFMEMNTRLQVEHPVTEMISKQDLVRWQLLVASGFELPCKQEELKIHGHAFETRIYAENPDNNFLPDTGTLQYLATPLSRPSNGAYEVEEESADDSIDLYANVRVDTGVRHKDEVSVHYDPMIAKLIVWDEDRDAALRRLNTALDQYNIVGLANNVSFLKRVIQHPTFIEGGTVVDTNFIDTYKDDILGIQKEINSKDIAITALYSVLNDVANGTTTNSAANFNASSDPWATLNSKYFNLQGETTIELQPSSDDEQPLKITITHLPNGQYQVTSSLNDQVHIVSGSFDQDSNTLNICLDDHLFTCTVVQNENDIYIFNGDDSFSVTLPEPSYLSSSIPSGSLISPMPGRILEVKVKPGDTVNEGDPLIIMEAMKMQHSITATSAGTVGEVFCAVDEYVEGKKALISIN